MNESPGFMKVSTKLTLLVLVAVLLPLLGLGGAVYFMQKQVIEERLQQQLHQQGTSAVHHIRDRLLGNYRDLALVAGSSTLRPHVWTPEYGLNRYLASFPMYDALIYTDDKGKLIAHAGAPLLTEGDASLEHAASDWHQAALAGVKVIDRVTPKQGAMPRYLVFARQVSDPGIVHGWVFAQVNSEKIVTLIEDAKIGQTGRITLFNRNGALIGHPNKSRYGFDMSAYPIMRKPLEKGTGDPGNFFVSGDGREKWGLTMMLPVEPELADLRWGIIVDQTRDELYESIGDLRNTILLGAAVFGFAFALFGILFARRLVAPLFGIKRTLNGFFDYLSGKATIPVHHEIAGNDEFAQMARAIGENIKVAEKSITEQQRAESERHESAKRYQTIIQTSFDGYWLVDLEGHLIDANEAAAKMLGYTREAILGLGVQDIDTTDTINTPADIPARTERMLKSCGERSETKHRKQSGEIIDVEVSINLLPNGSAFVVFVHDITKRKQMEEQVRQLAFYDVLTHLPNRRLLHDRLSQALTASKRNGCYGALLFLDLDNFKPLNDTHGHAVGDLLLIETARRLQSCVRAIDTVSRFGGDEFVVVISELEPDRDESVEHARRIAEKIRAALSETYFLTGARQEQAATPIEHHCPVSIGVEMFFDHVGKSAELMKSADAAMYRAKDAGRNQIQFGDSI